MNKYRSICLLVLLICFFQSLAQDDNLLLEGTIGKVPIVMEITFQKDGLTATYFYKKHKQSIDLEGKFTTPETIELKTTGWNSPMESVQLKDIGDDKNILYTGTWKDLKNNKTLPIALHPIDMAKVETKNSYVKNAKLRDLDYVRLADIVLKQDSIQMLTEEISAVWLSDAYQAFHGFRILQNPKIKGIDSVNAHLEELQYSEMLNYFNCMAGGDKPEYESGTGSVYVRNHVLSFSVLTYYFCGGAHPDGGSTGFTYNLETGKGMEISDFLFFGKTKADYSKDEDYLFGGEILGPNLVKLLKKLYPNEMTPPKNPEEDWCDYSSKEVWDYPAWYLTKDGLYLYPYFFRAARACDGADFSVIPYEELVKYKNPKVSIPMKY